MRILFNVSILAATVIAAAIWADRFTDWIPEWSGAAVPKIAIGVVVLALSLWLGKDFKDKLADIARRFFSSAPATWLILLVVVIGFAVTSSARTVEIQASDDPVTVKLSWSGELETVKLEAKKPNRSVHFAWPFAPLTASASAPCKKDVSSAISAYSKWQLQVNAMEPVRGFILRGTTSFSQMFAGGVPPLDLVIDADPASGQPGVIRNYRGQAVYLGDCACKKTAQANVEPDCPNTPALSSPDGSPRLKLVCGQPKPCHFETLTGRVTYQRGYRVPERMSPLSQTNPRDPQVWEIAMEWQK